MPRYHAVIPSTWSIDRAFSYMSDFANAQEWDPGVLEARQVGGGPIGIGTEFDLVVKFGGRRREMRYRLRDFEPTHRIVFESSTKVLRSVDSLTFESRPGGCEMTYDADLRFNGVAALANPLLAMFFRRVGERARDSLNQTLGR
ncbi:MAG TPA: SRPBCC family protein [Acidimicrobiales bacterium]|nr:SRPBCC family protein [Acidimicrobiales bacterium]